VVFDLSAPAAIEDPHSYFHGLRADGPVHWSDRHRAWLVVSHAGVQAAFRDPHLSSERLPTFERLAASQPEGFGAVVDLLRGWMVFRDDPAHDALRDPVRRAFTPRMIESLAPAIERITTSQLDAMPVGDVVDLRTAFAGPLPALVIADLLGVPAADRA
jgi:cytochrome P450